MDGISRSRNAAADWVVRLSNAETACDDWLAFETWLQAGPDHRRAYDETLSLWRELDGVAAHLAIDDAFDQDNALVHRHRGPIATPSAWWAAGAVCALAAIAISSGVYLRPAQRSGPSPVAYATERGKQMAIQLADGTRIDLAGASRVVVRFDANHRDVTLTSGEAAFKVIHDRDRPFTVAVGDRKIEDIGTEFDIRRGAADVAVTVRQGRVQVSAAGGSGASVSVSPGQRLRHNDGSEASVVEDVAADDVLAWKTGRLVYRDQPLRVVTEDLNRYFSRPLKIGDAKTADLRFSGVLMIDSEAPTVNRLTALLPVSAKPLNGAIILGQREEPR